MYVCHKAKDCFNSNVAYRQAGWPGYVLWHLTDAAKKRWINVDSSPMGVITSHNYRTYNIPGIPSISCLWGLTFFFADALHIFSAFSDNWILLNADALHAYWWFLKCNSAVFITVTCCVIVQMTLFNPLPTLRYSAPPKREFPFSCTTCSYWRPR